MTVALAAGSPLVLCLLCLSQNLLLKKSHCFYIKQTNTEIVAAQVSWISQVVLNWF